MFPTTRKAALAVLLVAALIAALTSPSFADKKDDLEKQKKGVSGKIDDAKKDLEASSQKYAAAVAALKRAQGKLNTAQSKLNNTRGALATAKAQDAQMQAKLVSTEAQLDAAVARLSKGKAELRASEAKVEQFAVQNIEQGDPGMRAFSELLQGEDPNAFSEQMSLNDAVSEDQVATMQSLAAARVILEVNRDRVTKLRDQVKKQRKAAAANLVRKQQLEDAAEAQAAEVAQLVTARRGARFTAAKLRAADKKQLESLEADRRSLEARIRALTPKQVRDAGGDGGGTLSYPANGPVTSQYGMRFHPVLHVWKLHDGTDFGIPCGTTVRAAAGGTVLQTYYNGGYGNRVILNNGRMRGKSVVTTYNHLTRWTVSPGQRVKRGQRIGYSGTTGYSTGCHLHFMVIANGSTVNPMNWL
ncbi:peptidoglycan DD-metalloendopeptidase family protein [Aeromicrobium sp. NPDC092404]|uniref:peptidoglycan DD-metalloendopeptidase family protein n=1 Tax=Aeromicrobium sp. NPDC092404 TaxID=3154976 RepID=UPI00342EAE03